MIVVSIDSVVIMTHQNLSLETTYRDIKRDNLVSFGIFNKVLNMRSINVVKALGSSFASKIHFLS